MLTSTMTIVAAVAFGLAVSLPAHAESDGQGGIKSLELKGHDMKAMEKKAPAAPLTYAGPMGVKVHESAVDGFRLAYHVMDNQEAMAKMKDMPGMAMKDHDMSKMKSHHLMLYLQGPDGKPLTDAKLGYLVKGPDGKEQKTMTMAMEGGYGADVDFSAKGAYQVKTKAIAGGKTLVDEFTYEVK